MVAFTQQRGPGGPMAVEGYHGSFDVSIFDVSMEAPPPQQEGCFRVVQPKGAFFSMAHAGKRQEVQ